MNKLTNPRQSQKIISIEKKPHKHGAIVQWVGIILIIMGVIGIFTKNIPWPLLIIGVIIYFVGMMMGSSIKISKE